MSFFADEIDRVERVCAAALQGRVADVTGMTVIVTGLPAPIGAMCRILRAIGGAVDAQVVGFRDDRAVLMPLSDTQGVARGLLSFFGFLEAVASLLVGEINAFGIMLAPGYSMLLIYAAMILVLLLKPAGLVVESSGREV